MWHVQEYHITAQALEQRLGINSFETYLVRRRLRWLGHVRRMPSLASQTPNVLGVLTSDGVQTGDDVYGSSTIPEDLRLAEEAGMVFQRQQRRRWRQRQRC
jgi:hypothetical protein